MDINLSLCELSRRGEKTQPLDYDFKLGDGKIGSDLGEGAEKAEEDILRGSAFIYCSCKLMV